MDPRDLSPPSVSSDGAAVMLEEDLHLELPELSEEQQQTLQAFSDCLLDANQHVNLTATRDAESLWNRHILDSLLLAPVLPFGIRMLDLGSGGGFPAIPLKIVRPDLEITLVESTGKKAAFLQRASQSLLLERIQILAERSEILAHQSAHRNQYDIVTARAVAALPALVELAVPFLRPEGRFLAMKGRSVAEEIETAERAFTKLNAALTRLLPYSDSRGEEACILEIIRTGTTPKAYPRAPGQPAKFPL